jgi:hypothetical protein
VLQLVDQLYQRITGSFGPFRSMDKVSLDVVLDIEDYTRPSVTVALK